MPNKRQVKSVGAKRRAAPKKSVSVRFKPQELELITQACEIEDEYFQRFAVKKLCAAATAVIEEHERKTA